VFTLDVGAHAHQTRLLASSLFKVISPSYYTPLDQRCWNSVVNKLREKIMFSKWPAELYLYPNKGLTCIISHFTELPIWSYNA